MVIRLETIIPVISQISNILNEKLTEESTLFYTAVGYPNKTIPLQLSPSVKASAELLSLLNKNIPVNLFIKYITQKTISMPIKKINGYPEITYEKLTAAHQKITIFYIKNKKHTLSFFVREFSNGHQLINKIISDMAKK